MKLLNDMSKWDKKERLKLYKRTKDVFGVFAQLGKVSEELLELKFEVDEMRKINPASENMFSEIADVTIMLEQLTNILKDYDKETEYKIKQQIEYKLNRLEKRINGK